MRVIPLVLTGLGPWILVLEGPGLYLEVVMHVLYINKYSNLFTDLFSDISLHNSYLCLSTLWVKGPFPSIPCQFWKNIETKCISICSYLFLETLFANFLYFARVYIKLIVAEFSGIYCSFNELKMDQKSPLICWIVYWLLILKGFYYLLN